MMARHPFSTDDAQFFPDDLRFTQHRQPIGDPASEIDLRECIVAQREYDAERWFSLPSMNAPTGKADPWPEMMRTLWQRPDGDSWYTGSTLLRWRQRGPAVQLRACARWWLARAWPWLAAAAYATLAVWLVRRFATPG